MATSNYFFFSYMASNIPIEYKSIWHADMILMSWTILGRSGHGSNGNERVLHFPQFSWTWLSLSDVV